MASPDIMRAYEIAIIEFAMDLNHCGYLDVTDEMYEQAEHFMYDEMLANQRLG